MTNEILTGALVLITGFYAWATYKILKANERVVEVMREQAEAVTRPYVTVSAVLEPDNPIFYLRIANLGKTAANDLSLRIDRPFFAFGQNKEDHNLAERFIFKNTITSFPAGSEIVFSLAQSFVIFGENADGGTVPSSFVVTAEYSYAGKRVKESNPIDLRPYLGATIPQDAYVRKLKAMIEAIEKIANQLGRSES
jgi:hypothetical protein